ncbi:hypothetical protein WM15_28420 [Burkholderia ubonensis]|nr:hypothetical protein WM15_28420 [Burkholderia ubonensis]
MRDIAALEFCFEPSDRRRIGDRAHEPPLIAPLNADDRTADALERRHIASELAREARMRGIVATDQLDGPHVVDERRGHH